VGKTRKREKATAALKAANRKARAKENAEAKSVFERLAEVMPEEMKKEMSELATETAEKINSLFPADDYDDDLRPALMLPKGDPIREAAVKVQQARRGKGE